MTVKKIDWDETYQIFKSSCCVAWTPRFPLSRTRTTQFKSEAKESQYIAQESLVSTDRQCCVNSKASLVTWTTKTKMYTLNYRFKHTRIKLWIVWSKRNRGAKLLWVWITSFHGPRGSSPACQCFDFEKVTYWHVK